MASKSIVKSLEMQNEDLASFIEGFIPLKENQVLFIGKWDLETGSLRFSVISNPIGRVSPRVAAKWLRERADEIENGESAKAEIEDPPMFN